MKQEVYEKLTKTDKDCLELGVLMAQDFTLFLDIIFYALYGSSFIFKSFHKIILEVLQEYGENRNEKTNLIINCPPRSGKSLIMKFFTAWGFVRNPRSNFLYTSYADSLVNTMSDGVRDIINSQLFRRCYPYIMLNPKKDAKDNWGIKDFGGEMYASPLGGRLTGFGAGILGYNNFSGAIIIDDFLKAQSAGSVGEKERVITYYSETLDNRVNNPKVPKIIIAQRLAVDDLVGWIIANQSEQYKVIKIAACDDSGRNSIWPEKWTEEHLMNMKKVRPWYFYSQYMQEPIIKGGAVIKTEWFKSYSNIENIKFRRCFIVADTASKIKEHNDYSVFMFCGLDIYNNLYIIDILRGKWEADELIIKATQFWNKYRYGLGGIYCGGLFVEEKSSGIMLVQMLTNKSGIPVIAINSPSDKLSRVSLCLDYLASGKVYLPENEITKVNEFKTECEQFNREGTAPHDDQVDCLAYAIAIASSGWNIPAGQIL